jgi:hypothetical protein
MAGKRFEKKLERRELVIVKSYIDGNNFNLG